jgi:hypothetical protein
MEVVAARASAVAVEVHADRPAAGAPRARAGLVAEPREVGFSTEVVMGRLSTTRTPLRSPMPCYWEQRPVALQRRTALGQWYDARSAAWIDIQRGTLRRRQPRPRSRRVRPAASSRSQSDSRRLLPTSSSVARARLADLLASFTEGFDTADLEDARRLLAH